MTDKEPSQEEGQEGEGIQTIEDFTSLEWQPEGSSITFHFNKWKVMESLDFLEDIREAGNAQGRPVEGIAEMYNVIMHSTRDQMKQFRKYLLSTVGWSEDGIKQEPVLEHLETVFGDLAADDVYTVMFRALAVNFTRGTARIGATTDTGAKPA